MSDAGDATGASGSSPSSSGAVSTPVKDYSPTGKVTTPLWRLRWFQATLGVLLLLAVASYVVPAGFRLVYATRSVLTPVLVGIALAYILNPVVTWLYEKAKVPRPVTAAGMLGSMALFVLGLAVLVGVTLWQAYQFVQKVPQAVHQIAARDDLPAWIEPVVRWASATMRELDAATQAFFDQALRQGDVSRSAELATNGGAGAAATMPEAVDDEPTAPTTNDAEFPSENTIVEAAPGDEAGTIDATGVTDAVDTAATTQPVETAADEPGFFDDVLKYVEQVEWKAVAEASSTVLDLGAGAAGSVVGAVGYATVFAVIVAFVFFFTVWKFRDFVCWFDPYVPASKKERTYEILGMMDRSVSAFIRGRLIQATIMAVILTVGLLFTDARPYALLLGVAGGVLGLVPYVGLSVWPAAVIVASIVGLQQDGAVSLLWGVIAPSVVFFAAQSIDGYVVEPLVQGKATNLDALTVLLVVLLGGSLAGLLGLLIAIPIAACLKILWREVVAPELKAIASQA